MYPEEIITKLNKWLTTFVEVPNKNLDGWSPCPYAKQARLQKKIKIIFCKDLLELTNNLDYDLELLEQFEVLIYVMDTKKISVESLEHFMDKTNKHYMKNNYVFLEDHPEKLEFINGEKMNFGEAVLILVQKLDKLTEASLKLLDKGYYKSWSATNYDEVVSWRTK